MTRIMVGPGALVAWAMLLGLPPAGATAQQGHPDAERDTARTAAADSARVGPDSHLPTDDRMGFVATWDDVPDVSSGNTVSVVAGPRYRAGGLRELLLGEGHREVWLTPITVRELDPGALGGLNPVEQGGGMQSITLHFETEDGREYIFRSVDKHLEQGYPEDLSDTYMGDQIQDVISALYPAGSLVVGRLTDHTGILHVDSELYVMPDDARLGEYRETFAGMLGTFELIPNEGENDEALFAGSHSIKGTEEFLNDLDESALHQLNAPRFLKARLFDLILNDPDRGGDQWRWVEYESGDGWVWEPLPRDRDWVFVDAEGLLVRVGSRFYQKAAVQFDEEFPAHEPLTVQAWNLDRRLLQGLEWPVWEEQVRALQGELTDDAIRESLDALPAPWRDHSADRIVAVLTARRDALMEYAREYYELHTFETDVFGTDEAERAEIDRLPGGDIRLRIFREEEESPYFDRTYLEDETREVRLYLRGGDDTAVVEGSEDAGAIIVRIVGGDGDDTLIDRGSPSDWKIRTAFYDADGDNRFEGSDHTEIGTDDYEAPGSRDNFVEQRLLAEPQDWGGGSSYRPDYDYGDAAGVSLGAKWVRERQGFRTHPYRYRVDASLLVGTRNGSLGGEVGWSARSPVAPTRLDVRALATQLESFRFFGFGNETPRPEGDIDATLIDLDRVEASITGFLEADFGDVELGVGPLLRYTDPRPPEGSPLIPGPGPWRAGMHAVLGVDRSLAGLGQLEYRIDGRAEVFPGVWHLPSPIQIVDGSFDVRVPMEFVSHGTGFVVRAGGRHVWGDEFPVVDAASIGGSESLRGYRFRRFTGRSAAYGGAELQIGLFDLELLTRGRLGVLGFEDIGRVWWDEDDSNEWHGGHGFGIWYETLDFVVRGSVARGEETRYYLELESPL